MLGIITISTRLKIILKPLSVSQMTVLRYGVNLKLVSANYLSHLSIAKFQSMNCLHE